MPLSIELEKNWLILRKKSPAARKVTNSEGKNENLRRRRLKNAYFTPFSEIFGARKVPKKPGF